MPAKYVVERLPPSALIVPAAISLRIGSARSLVAVPSCLLICSMRRPGCCRTNATNRSDSASMSLGDRLTLRRPGGRPARGRAFDAPAVSELLCAARTPPNADRSVSMAARCARSAICVTKPCTVRFISFCKSLIQVLFKASWSGGEGSSSNLRAPRVTSQLCNPRPPRSCSSSSRSSCAPMESLSVRNAKAAVACSTASALSWVWRTRARL